MFTFLNSISHKNSSTAPFQAFWLARHHSQARGRPSEKNATEGSYLHLYWNRFASCPISSEYHLENVSQQQYTPFSTKNFSWLAVSHHVSTIFLLHYHPLTTNCTIVIYLAPSSHYTPRPQHIGASCRATLIFTRRRSTTGTRSNERRRRRQCRHAFYCSWGGEFGYYNFNAKQRVFRQIRIQSPAPRLYLKQE